MPVKQGYENRDGERWGYYQFGSQKRYYYTPGNETARKRAKTKAEQQQAAAYAGGYDG